VTPLLHAMTRDVEIRSPCVDVARLATLARGTHSVAGYRHFLAIVIGHVKLSGTVARRVPWQRRQCRGNASRGTG